MIENVIPRTIPKRKKNKRQQILFFSAALLTIVLGVLLLNGENFLSFFIFVGLPVWLTWHYLNLRTWHAAWRKFSKLSGFTYQEYKPDGDFKWPYVFGTYGGYSVLIEKSVYKLGDKKEAYTSVKVSCEKKISQAMDITPFSRLLGANNISIGNQKELRIIKLEIEELNKELNIRSSSEQFARNMLSSQNVQQAIFEILSQSVGMRVFISGNELYYHEAGIIMDGEYLFAIVKMLVDLARSAERYG